MRLSLCGVGLCDMCMWLHAWMGGLVWRGMSRHLLVLLSCLSAHNWSVSHILCLVDFIWLAKYCRTATTQPHCLVTSDKAFSWVRHLFPSKRLLLSTRSHCYTINIYRSKPTKLTTFKGIQIRSVLMKSNKPAKTGNEKRNLFMVS